MGYTFSLFSACLHLTLVTLHRGAIVSGECQDIGSVGQAEVNVNFGRSAGTDSGFAKKMMPLCE